MSLGDLLKKLAFMFEKKLNSVLTTDVDMQLKYVNHFTEPTDDIERSYYQYRCLMKLYGGFFSFCLNLLSVPISWYYIFSITKRDIKANPRQNMAVFLRDGKPDSIIANCLRNRFNYIEVNPVLGNSLTKDDLKFIFSIIKRYPFAWHFTLKLILKISLYRSIVSEYNPAAIIVCNEYSFTSSALTSFCKRMDICHINIMHGEKLLFMRDSFFHFDECHIWSEGYKRIFEMLRAERLQFRVSVPESLVFSKDITVAKAYDYTYYFAAENEETLDKILQALLTLKEKGYCISVRPHPRYSKIDKIRSLFSDFEVENCDGLRIEESVLRTRNAISLYSTVLNQAFHNGVNIVIDDISNTEYYNQLKKLKYVMLIEDHMLLSDVILSK